MSEDPRATLASVPLGLVRRYLVARGWRRIPDSSPHL
jgi:hypothetical protein